MSWFFKNNGANNFNISTSINVYGKNTDNTELEKDVRREREKDAPTELEKDGDEVGLEKGEGDEGLLKRKRDEEKEKPEREESKKSEKVNVPPKLVVDKVDSGDEDIAPAPAQKQWTKEKIDACMAYSNRIDLVIQRITKKGRKT